MKLIGIKTNNGVFLTRFDATNQFQQYINPISFCYVINGEEPRSTFLAKWCLISSEPVTVQRRVKHPNINERYELRDPTLVDRFSPIVPREEATYVSDGERFFTKEFKTISSLYEFMSDPAPDTLEDVAFEYETVAVVEELQPKEFSFGSVSSDNIHHQLIDQLLFPQPLLQERPCELSPTDSYRIIREYVKQHIDFNVARITSDYDFCFTVTKIIPLSETITFTVDVNNSYFQKRKRKPKYEQRFRSRREVTIFEAAPKPYQKYPVVSGFRGETQDDLRENIETYLVDLIAFINKPVTDCPHCKGLGVIDPNHK